MSGQDIELANDPSSDLEYEDDVETGLINKKDETIKTNKIEENKCLGCTFFLLIILFGLSLLCFIVAFIIFMYLAFANFLQYSFYPLLYGWISSIGFGWLHKIFTMIYMLSDFGLYFSLLTITLLAVKNVAEIIVYCVVTLGGAIWHLGRLEDNLFIEMGMNKVDILILTFFFTAFDVLIGVSLYYQVVLHYLLTIIIVALILYFYDGPTFSFFITDNFDDVKEEDEDDFDDNCDDEKKKEENDDDDDIASVFQKLVKFPIIYHQMIKNNKRENCEKIICALFVLTGQFYVLYIAIDYYISVKTTSIKVGIIFGIIMRILGLYRAIDINIFDSLFYCCKTSKLLEKDGFSNIPFIATLVLSIAGFGVAWAGTIYLLIRDMPYVDYVNYIKDLNEWDRTNQTIDRPIYCSSTYGDTGLFTDDFAALATLPRLYEIKNGKCYIQPKFRGVFNSTMKYIFGEDYSSKGISIMCYPKTHNPYLVLTSEEFYQITKQRYSNQIKEEKENLFPPKSEDYFSKSELCSDGIAKKECNALKASIDNKEEAAIINSHWEKYTNQYWKNYKGSAEKTAGLEQYQYTITDDVTFQPRIIDKKGNKMNGLHLVIGGGFEDEWGHSYLLESLARSFIPDLFGNFIPMYDFITGLFGDVFNTLAEFVNGFIFVKNFSYDEMYSFGDLMSKFDFAHNQIFMIGQTISASTIKEFSFVSDINGISFDGSKSIDYAKFRISEKYQQEEEYVNGIINLFSDGYILSGNDDSFDINGKLPKLFRNPNVYDTMCLVSATCSETKKYEPLCLQVLTQSGANPIEKYGRILDAVNDKYN